ncbi:hypothetical protein Btru_066751 [Bulinus truncatus]|nr:hypothetical protein Btru_066751 [Bulinus truncatus]
MTNLIISGNIKQTNGPSTGQQTGQQLHVSGVFIVLLETALALENLLPVCVVVLWMPWRGVSDRLVAAFSIVCILSALVPAPLGLVSYFYGGWYGGVPTCTTYQVTSLWCNLSSLALLTYICVYCNFSVRHLNKLFSADRHRVGRPALPLSQPHFSDSHSTVTRTSSLSKCSCDRVSDSHSTVTRTSSLSKCSCDRVSDSHNHPNAVDVQTGTSPTTNVNFRHPECELPVVGGELLPEHQQVNAGHVMVTEIGHTLGFENLSGSKTYDVIGGAIENVKYTIIDDSRPRQTQRSVTGDKQLAGVSVSRHLSSSDIDYQTAIKSTDTKASPWCPTTVNAYDNTTCNAHDNTTCNAHDNTTCTAHDNTTCNAHDNTTCNAHDNTTCNSKQGKTSWFKTCRSRDHVTLSLFLIFFLTMGISSLPVIGFGPSTDLSPASCRSWLVPTPTRTEEKVFYIVFIIFLCICLLTGCSTGVDVTLQVSRRMKIERKRNSRLYLEEKVPDLQELSNLDGMKRHYSLTCIVMGGQLTWLPLLVSCSSVMAGQLTWLPLLVSCSRVMAGQLTWLPLLLMMVLQKSGVEVSEATLMYSNIVTSLPGLLNPLLYSLALSNYRTGYKAVINKCCCRQQRRGLVSNIDRSHENEQVGMNVAVHGQRYITGHFTDHSTGHNTGSSLDDEDEDYIPETASGQSMVDTAWTLTETTPLQVSTETMHPQLSTRHSRCRFHDMNQSTECLLLTVDTNDETGL